MAELHRFQIYTGKQTSPVDEYDYASQRPIYDHVMATDHEDAIQRWLKGGFFGLFRRREHIKSVTKLKPKTRKIVFAEE